MKVVVTCPAWKSGWETTFIEERDVGLDAADAEFAQGAVHALAGDLRSGAPRR
jgi:hypothetical protein